jgi:putative transposase
MCAGPRVRSDGHEVQLPTWSTAQAEDWLGRWAMNLMLINVSTRKLKRAVRLPEGDLQAVTGDGTSKSAASRRFVALSAERMAEWMASDLSQLDLPVIQIDGLHIGNDLVLVGALVSTAKATNIRLASSKERPRTRPSYRHSSTI